jgi:hypothetical protein
MLSDVQGHARDRRPSVKVLWIGTKTECEPDIVKDCEEAGVTIEVWDVHEDALDLGPLSPKTRMRVAPPGMPLVKALAKASFDLAVLRYPYYLLEVKKELLGLERPIVAWGSEQGPTLEFAINASRGFTRIAVNNRLEMPIYRKEFPGAKILYLPFGCTDRGTLAGPPERDLIADGGCHYLCTGCAGTLKRTSVDVLVRPVMTGAHSLSLYGSSVVEHGWPGVPGYGTYYKGAYAADEAASVYARHKLYLGISWNWQHGGFGIKLARVLASGLPVLWHRTPGMREEGLHVGEHLVVTSSAKETLDHVAYLLRDEDYRRALGEKGRAFALNTWRWAPNLMRLREEIS